MKLNEKITAFGLAVAVLMAAGGFISYTVGLPVAATEAQDGDGDYDEDVARRLEEVAIEAERPVGSQPITALDQTIDDVTNDTHHTVAAEI